MRTSIIFAACCGVICAGLFWAAASLEAEPFYVCLAVFAAGFWGGLAALSCWALIEARGKRRAADDFCTIIWR